MNYVRLIIITIILLVCKINSQDDKPPECKNIDKVGAWINYPDSAKKYGIEGRVTVKLLVGLHGEVIKTGVMTGPEIFYEEVKRVSMLLKFTPAKHNGEFVKCWVTVPFNFKIPNEEEEEK